MPNTKAGTKTPLKERRPGTRPKLRRSRIDARHRPEPKGSRGRPALPPSTAPTATSAPKQERGTSTATPPQRQSSSRRKLLSRSRWNRTPPPRPRRRRRSGTPTREGRDREDLFHGAAVASASTTPLGNTNLNLLEPNLPAGKTPAVSATSRRPTGHWRRRRPPAPPAGTRALPFAALNCSTERLREGRSLAKGPW